ncbi:hypothetical protein THIOKS12170001 [Thiocapsa sp. KS1]|nr:hypothetical protein THIOKS12170001 [Thiocapsa sp. KS1]
MFDWVAASARTAEASFDEENGFRHRFRYLDGVPLNDANFDLEVNVLEYREHAPDGSVLHFSRVTVLPVDNTNLTTLMRGARARWKIETLEDRKRDLQHPQEPRRSLRAQLRSRQTVSQHRTQAPDDAGVSDRSDPTALLPAV